MGRLNKKIAKKVPTKPSGLSRAATKGLVSFKKVIELPTSVTESAPAPSDNFISVTKLVESQPGPSQARDKKRTANSLGLGGRLGKVVKIKKKDKMKLRRGVLVNKLLKSEKIKEEEKEKQNREKVVIVKDTKPLLENLLEIADEIETDKKKKNEREAATSKKKLLKHTMKKKKAKEQFLKDMKFLKAATEDPSYIADPFQTVSIHLKNSIELSPMKANWSTRVVGRKVILVPYTASHVEKYHGWMSRLDLQQLTGSEPLSLEEEFKMQKTWKEDDDKCTFIILHKEKFQQSGDEINSMIGDTNLFMLGENEAEAEIMIAEDWARGQGLGWESMLLMLRYGVDHLNLRAFQAKIKTGNLASINMFSKIGFKEVSRSEIFDEITFEIKVESEFLELLNKNTTCSFEIYCHGDRGEFSK